MTLFFKSMIIFLLFSLFLYFVNGYRVEEVAAYIGRFLLISVAKGRDEQWQVREHFGENIDVIK